MALAEVDVAGLSEYDKTYRKPKRRRAVARFTLEVLEQMFHVPDGVRLVNMSFNPDRGIVAFYLEGDGLPERFEAPEGQEGMEVVMLIPGWEDYFEHFPVDRVLTDGRG